MDGEDAFELVLKTAMDSRETIGELRAKVAQRDAEIELLKKKENARIDVANHETVLAYMEEAKSLRRLGQELWMAIDEMAVDGNQCLQPSKRLNAALLNSRPEFCRIED